MLMRGAWAAQFEGVFEPYFRAAYHHMWEEPKKMDDVETFRQAFISSGIDIDKLIARAQQDDVKKKLIEVTTDAVNRGAFGSPTFLSARKCSSARINCAMSRNRLSNSLALQNKVCLNRTSNLVPWHPEHPWKDPSR
jgi:hypothetical protein